MKLNVKKFLSILCTVTSISGVCASLPVSASTTPENIRLLPSDFYSRDPRFTSPVNEDDDEKYTKALPESLVKCIESRQKINKKNWYDSACKLLEEGIIDTYQAVMLVMISNTYDHTYFIRDYNVKEWLCTGNWELLESILNFYSKRTLSLTMGTLDLNISLISLVFFGRYKNHEYNLEQLLKKLDPSNEEFRRDLLEI